MYLLKLLNPGHLYSDTSLNILTKKLIASPENNAMQNYVCVNSAAQPVMHKD